jgi:3-oxoacyl-[acyl-carrier protein] reductase
VVVSGEFFSPFPNPKLHTDNFQKSLPHMGPSSSIILLTTSLTAISSISPAYLLYVATKGAIEQITRVLAKDLGRRGITVNAVGPGPTATDMFFEGKSPELVRQLESLSPFGRLGTPEEIAGVVAFLAGEGARWVSGQVLRVNGGAA